MGKITIHNSNHFSGESSSDSRKKNKSTRKKRKMKHNTHINKYIEFSITAPNVWG